jgi:hypothetical protein
MDNASEEKATHGDMDHGLGVQVTSNISFFASFIPGMPRAIFGGVRIEM